MPACSLEARCDVIVDEKAVANMVMKRDKKASGVDMILRRRSFAPG